MVPRFLLPPLVENAIKHGIGTLEEGGAVETTVTRLGSDFLLQVHNDAGENASESGAMASAIEIRANVWSCSIPALTSSP